MCFISFICTFYRFSTVQETDTVKSTDSKLKNQQGFDETSQNKEISRKRKTKTPKTKQLKMKALQIQIQSRIVIKT